MTKGEVKSQMFKFILTTNGINSIVENMENESPEDFKKLTMVGIDILKYANDDDVENLDKLCQNFREILPLTQRFVSDAFQEALHYKNEAVLKYFLENGLDLDETAFQDCILTLTDISRYTADDPPFEILELLLQYGANPNYTDRNNFRTAMHLSCKFGIYDYVKILYEHKADINCVDKKGNMPMNYIQKKEKKNAQGLYKQIGEFLKSKGAKDSWRTTMVST